MAGACTILCSQGGAGTSEEEKYNNNNNNNNNNTKQQQQQQQQQQIQQQQTAAAATTTTNTTIKPPPTTTHFRSAPTLTVAARRSASAAAPDCIRLMNLLLPRPPFPNSPSRCIALSAPLAQCIDARVCVALRMHSSRCCAADMDLLRTNICSATEE